MNQHLCLFLILTFNSQIKIGETTISSSNLGVDIPPLNIENTKSEGVKETLTKLKKTATCLTISKTVINDAKARRYRRKRKANFKYAESSESETEKYKDDEYNDPDFHNDNNDSDDFFDGNIQDDENDKDFKPSKKSKANSKSDASRRNRFTAIKVNAPPVFICMKCKAKFGSFAELKQHVASEKSCSIAVLTCDVCFKECPTRKSLMSHMNTHNKKEKHACDKCGKEFSQAIILENHKAHQHGEYVKNESPYSFKCRVCWEEFTSRVDLYQHMKNHDAKEESHLCDICGKCFSNRHNLGNHRKIHFDHRPHQCQQCPKKYRTPLLLRQHMHVHTGIKEFICEICAKEFAKKCSLSIHLKKYHSNETIKLHKLM